LQVICKSEKNRQSDEKITNYGENNNLPLKFNSKKNRRYTPSRVRNNKSHKNEEKNKTEIKTPSKTKIVNEESIP